MFRYLIRMFSLDIPLLVQNSLVLKDDSIQIVGNVRIVGMKSVSIVNLLVVDVHLNVENICMQIVLSKSKKSTCVSISISPSAASSFAFLCALFWHRCFLYVF